MSKLLYIIRYFVPEVGVSLTENSKSKNGGKDFSTMFGKPSKYEYISLTNQSIKKTLNTSNYAISTEPSDKQKLEKTNNNKSSNNFKDSSELSLPLLDNRNIKSSIPTFLTKTKTSESIRISNKLTMSLKSALDSLDLIPEYEENRLESNNIDIFKRRKNYLQEKKELDKKLISSSLDEINKFNYNILKNKGWGQSAIDRLKLEEPKIYYKPNKKELERELGQNIVNKKLPRSRIITTFSDKIK